MKKMNPKEFIKENIDLLGDASHHAYERLVKRLLKTKFEMETGFYYDRFNYYDDYEEQKKFILTKFDNIGLTKKLYLKYHKIPHCLRTGFLLLEDCHPHTIKKFERESDKNFLKIIHMDNFIPNDSFTPLKKRDEVLFKYFAENGIETKDIRLSKKIMKVKKTSKEYKKIRDFIIKHNKLIKIMIEFDRI